MIFPIAWQEPKTANGLQLLNRAEIKQDKHIVFIDNRQNVFPGIPGAEWTNIILWNNKYDNGLDGSQLILDNGTNAQTKKLIQSHDEVHKPEELIALSRLVSDASFKSMVSATSVRKPYGLATDVADRWASYGLEEIFKSKQSDDDLVLICSNQKCYLPKTYSLPRETKAKYKFKIFVPNAWGNLSKSYIGGAYADIIIADPGTICSETYLESGCFDSKDEAKKHAKYLMTRFCRGLLFLNKHSLLCAKSWDAIPVQDYSEPWWDLSIEEIDEKLMDKYSVPQNIRDFVKNNIQTKSEVNIVNF